MERLLPGGIVTVTPGLIVRTELFSTKRFPGTTKSLLRTVSVEMLKVSSHVSGSPSESESGVIVVFNSLQICVESSAISNIFTSSISPLKNLASPGAQHPEPILRSEVEIIVLKVSRCETANEITFLACFVSAAN